MRTREAVLPDAEQIHALISAYSGDGTLLPRSLAEICENVRDFVVLETTAASSGAGRFIFMAPTSPRSARSPSRPGLRDEEAEDCW